jgi:GNAT superfamily N-acetyltransferase
LSSWVAGASTDASGRPLTEEPRPGEAFASRWGLTNRLADLHRVLDLPVPAERLQQLAEQTAPYASGYRMVQWTTCPPEYVDEYCHLRSSIVSEAPMGEMEMDDEAWDEKRLRTDEDLLQQMQRTGYTTAAVAADGRLAGHTQLVVPGTEPGRIYQWDTLVLPEHRGHRLGLALKAANLGWVQAQHPDRTQVHTYNAADNDPMGSVNDALGFRAVELMGEWQGPLPA